MKIRVKMTDMQWYKRPTTDTQVYDVPNQRWCLGMPDSERAKLIDFALSIAIFLTKEPEGEIRITRSSI